MPHWENERRKKMEREKRKKKSHTALIFYQCDSVSKNHDKIVKARKAQPDSW